MDKKNRRQLFPHQPLEPSHLVELRMRAVKVDRGSGGASSIQQFNRVDARAKSRAGKKRASRMTEIARRCERNRLARFASGSSGASSQSFTCWNTTSSACPRPSRHARSTRWSRSKARVLVSAPANNGVVNTPVVSDTSSNSLAYAYSTRSIPVGAVRNILIDNLVMSKKRFIGAACKIMSAIIRQLTTLALISLDNAARIRQPYIHLLGVP